MHGLELTVMLGAAILVGSGIANRFRLPTPLLLLAAGLVLGFIPQLRRIHLDPEIVLLLFLPVMLFWESLTTSLRSLRRDFIGVILMSTLLVVASAFAAGGIAYALGMSWAAALVLGAAVAPPDATAVAALGNTLPHRNFMLLKAESLTNDGTALVVYAIAVGVASGGTYTPWRITSLVLLSYGGGVLVGLAVAVLAYVVMNRLRNATTLNIAMLLVPFTAYLVAELIHASGVLAVVVAGLLIAAVSHRMSDATARRQTEFAWPLGAFVLNGALFVLIGVEVQALVHELPLARLGHLLLVIVAVWLALIAVRFVFQVATMGILRVLHITPRDHDPLTLRARTVSSFAGFRGGVSLAIAFSVPAFVSDGRPFPEREEIIFVTAGVIVLTLVVQGPLLPTVVRWANLPEEVSTDEEMRWAEVELTRSALKALPDLAGEHDSSPEVRERAEESLHQQLRVAEARKTAEVNTVDELPDVAEGDEVPEEHEHLSLDEEFTRLRLALVEQKRAKLMGLRRDGSIDDSVFRQLQARLDAEEIRFAGIGDLEA